MKEKEERVSGKENHAGYREKGERGNGKENHAGYWEKEECFGGKENREGCREKEERWTGKRENARIEDRQLPFAHWLYGVPGVGSRTIRHLSAKGRLPEELYHMTLQELESLFAPSAAGRKLAERIAASRQQGNVWRDYEELEKRNIRFTCLGNAGYPKRLSQIPDAPYGIYYRGRLPEQEKPAVAIIGARGCSEYGRKMAQCFGRDLAVAGIQIISGMARGIDGIGQQAAVEAGGYSLGVLGCGVDICYPSENRELYERLAAQGGICSEYRPGTEPKNSLFPPRNRIISGLADVVLVIEARNRSGTLITVDMALEQGREVYALPGRVTDALSEGCNRLLQQGANVAVSPEELIRNLTGQGTGTGDGIHEKSILSDVQADLLHVLQDTPLPIEIIKEHMLYNCRRDMTIQELISQLVKLCLMGYARQIGNSYFVKESW